MRARARNDYRFTTPESGIYVILVRDTAIARVIRNEVSP
jgi:hypothetical protein